MTKVKNAPSDAVILFTPIFRNYENKSISPYQLVSLLAQHSNAPIFSYWEVLLGSGVVGGYVLSGEKIGKRVGEAIISYSENNVLPTISDENLSVHKYDWRQLKNIMLPRKACQKNRLLLITSRVTLNKIKC
ncbi:hypothetical protein P4S68_12475 [Pseudoalteromonas sp. Hal099]